TQKEFHRIVDLIVDRSFGQNRIDLEAIETCLRDGLHRAGFAALGRLFARLEESSSSHAPACTDGHPHRKAGSRPKRLMTILGPVDIRRPYYYDALCKQGWSPFDHVLDVEGVMFSPGVRNMMAYVGSKEPFREAHEDLLRLAGLGIPAKSIERLCSAIGEQVEAYQQRRAPNSDLRMLGKGLPHETLYIEYDGTGVPVLKRETVGRKGKGADGVGKTREMKVGCVFTQTRVNDDGYAVRDEASTSYVGACETAEDFQWRILHHARVRGLDLAHRLCVLGDGAPWIWNIADEHFPTAYQIVDLYHARQHYSNVGKLFLPENSKELKQWLQKRERELDKGDTDAVIRALARLQSRSKHAREVRDKGIMYFRNNACRMRYRYFRNLGLFVGSGVIEAGCKTVVGQRLKQSGMHWSIRSADNIVALRCLFLGNQWDDFWEDRAAA
ncbi:MAG: ISKra4 family transposase, partial [Proteobacteria bacterium]|nr:ISKra4 family transposase [Pseudomonadota bacterium]